MGKLNPQRNHTAQDQGASVSAAAVSTSKTRASVVQLLYAGGLGRKYLPGIPVRASLGTHGQFIHLLLYLLAGHGFPSSIQCFAVARRRLALDMAEFSHVSLSMKVASLH